MVYLRKILIPTDLSEFSLAAMGLASSLGLLYAAKLYMLHVLEHGGPGLKRYGRERDADTNGPQHRAEATAAEELENFVTQKIGPGAKLHLVVRSGSASETIRRFAEEEGVDLIVMATHGRTGLRHMMMGSVAEKVVRMSQVPVLTVKPLPLREVMLGSEDIETELHLP